MSLLNYLLLCNDCGHKLEPTALKCPNCNSQKTIKIRLLLVVIILMLFLVMYLRHSHSAHENKILEKISLKYTTNTLIFGTSLTPDFTIKNLNTFPVKNITIKCDELTANGSIIDRLDSTITDVIQPQESKVFLNVDMGSIDNQTASVTCTIFSAETL